MTEFPRFGPNGAYAFFSDERDVPPGWQPTAEHAQRMQTLAPPIGTVRHPTDAAVMFAETRVETVEHVGVAALLTTVRDRQRRGRRK